MSGRSFVRREHYFTLLKNHRLKTSYAGLEIIGFIEIPGYSGDKDKSGRSGFC